METSMSMDLQTLINNITVYLAGNNFQNKSIIKINNDNLSTNGELCFLYSLKAWRKVFGDKDVCENNCTTIFEHFMHTKNNNINGQSDTDITEEVLQSLVLASNNWPIKIEKCCLLKERVCVFLSRPSLIRNVVKAAIEHGQDFGRNPPTDKTFSLKLCRDTESDITTVRLQLIQKVTEKLLYLHGCKISDKGSTLQYAFTTKSQGIPEDNYKKCICGVVKNSLSNTKETALTWDKHIENKINELEELNEHKYFGMEECSANKTALLKDVGNAIAVFELLTVKPSRPIYIGCNSTADKSTRNTKGASFVLYNVARIETIIEKYNDKKSKGKYPDLLPLNDIDFSLLQQEEEWELIYNFILGYPEMIKDCLKHKPIFQTSPYVICLFLARLCQKFSVYYRKIRILTEPYDHLIPTMMARLYMLYALRTVLLNALALLNIKSVSHM